MPDEISYPRQYARTQRFTLGVPRAFTIAPDGSRVAFVRAASGTDVTHSLWVLDVADEPAERRVAAPEDLLGGSTEELSPEERARRERSREASAGIVAYATDRDVTTAAFALSGRLFVCDLVTGATTELDVPSPVIDPRPSPDGRYVAYVHAGSLRVVEVEGGRAVAVAEPSGPDQTWGLAEFVAGEEMGRYRGFWWSPGSDRLLVAHVDNTPVQTWWISDPANPDRAPQPVRYPAAGTPNADVTLALLELDGARTPVDWDRAAYPYLASVHWTEGHPPLLLVQARSQQDQSVLAVDPGTGRTRRLQNARDPHWLDLVPGVPAWTPDGRLVSVADRDDVRVLTIDDEPVTGADLQIRSVVDVGAESVLVTAAAGAAATDPEVGEQHVYEVSGGSVTRVSATPGVHGAVRSGRLTVLTSTRLDEAGTSVTVLRDGRPVAAVDSVADRPVITARPSVSIAGSRRIPAAVLLPASYRPGDGPLPVLLDPYGGPHARRVVAAQTAYLTSQWFADQGFAVVVADGRGTPGPSPSWEKAVHHTLADIVLDDQVSALQALAQDHPLDLGRVAIRGWSFGGYLAALAVLRRPDVFHAAVVGAPVTDLRLYDTHYQERYLGDPTESPEVYAANSLVGDAGLSGAADQHRPMMIIHGLADDNVVVAHSLRLSSALLAAGRPHEVLPLSGVTHMTPQEAVAENLLLLQVGFLPRSLGLEAVKPG
jgi:dipeptidyl-peptidase-4